MKPQRSLEVGTGLFVLLGFAALFFLTTQLPGSGLQFGADSGYRVTAKFDNIGDLKAGSPVSMAGVRIGRVEAVSFDANDYRAVATLRIDPQFDRIPDDSGKYIGIGPGGSDTFLKDGGQIEFTQSAIVLESLVNKFFANFASKGSEGTASGSSEEGK